MMYSHDQVCHTFESSGAGGRVWALLGSSHTPPVPVQIQPLRQTGTSFIDLSHSRSTSLSSRSFTQQPNTSQMERWAGPRPFLKTHVAVARWPLSVPIPILFHASGRNGALL